MSEAINFYTLPEAVETQLLALASRSDLLLLGETHGTQEVPRLILGLLPVLAQLGYSGLALEMPEQERDCLLEWSHGQGPPPPFFGPSSFRDGRGNAQVLSLVQQAARGGWNLLCFDVASVLPGDPWSAREQGMAGNLLRQWERHCPVKKVLGVCGNLHSRLTQPKNPELWPSFAHCVQEARHDLAVNSVNVIFHGGGFFNGEIKSFGPDIDSFGAVAEVRPPTWSGHTLDLHLPFATPVTFLEA